MKINEFRRQKSAEAVLAKLRHKDNNPNKLTASQLLALFSWKMKRKAHTKFSGKEQLLLQWEKVKDNVVVLVEDPGACVALDTSTVPSIEDMALSCHRKQKENEAISLVTNISDEAFERILAAHQARREGMVKDASNLEAAFDASVLENPGAIT